VTALPFRWWENGVLVSNSESEEEDIRPSIEPIEPFKPDPMLVVPSIEDPGQLSPGTHDRTSQGGAGAVEVKMEDASDDDEVKAQVWEEPQTWNGYVKHKESWVRRAGLKREREECERNGVAKRGRA
jgi:hypothetical protein